MQKRGIIWSTENAEVLRWQRSSRVKVYISKAYEEYHSVQFIFLSLGVSKMTVQRVLITQGLWESKRSREIVDLENRKTLLKKLPMHCNMPKEVERSPLELSNNEKRKYLFLKQVNSLNAFRERKAISKEQYDISYNGLISKMGIADKELQE